MILDTIIEHKKTEIDAAKSALPLDALKERCATAAQAVDFRAALQRDIGTSNHIIAEVKKASPSKGVIREDFDPVAIGTAYDKNGASAISVLTDTKFFQGRPEYLTLVKQNVRIPVFRKDFIIDAYQVYEAKGMGADALLLIAAVLEQQEIADLLGLTGELGLQALVEVHTREELTKTLDAGADIVGINNRNLKNFVTDIQTTLDLVVDIPDSVTVVSESGIASLAEIDRLKAAGVDAFLIGETFMRAQDPGSKLKEFVS